MPTPDFPGARFVPAAASNYSQPTRPTASISRVIIHDIEGTAQVGINVFTDPRSGVSAHYVVNSSTGEVIQMVPERNTAYHCGNFDYNRTSVGIEHEGFAHDPQAAQRFYTDTMYRTSAALVRDICARYGIPKERSRIIGHNEVPNPLKPGQYGGQSGHTDPGPYWDWEKFMALVRGEDVGANVIVQIDDPFCLATPSALTTQNNWFTVPYSDERFGTLLYTYTTSNPNRSRNSVLWMPELPTNGIYEVFAYTPVYDNGHPDTSAAVYSITDGQGQATRVTLNQAASTRTGFPRWLSLGRYFFTEGRGGASVYLGDLAPDNAKTLWFGALKFLEILLEAQR